MVFHTLISFVISDCFEWPPCIDFSLQDNASYIVTDYHAIASVDAGTLPLCATRWLLSCTNTPSSHLHFDAQESVSEWSTRLDDRLLVAQGGYGSSHDYKLLPKVSASREEDGFFHLPISRFLLST